MNAECSYETSESFNAMTQRQIQGERNVQLRYCGNLKIWFLEETAVV